MLEGCTVYDYETDSTGGVYDLTAAEKAPYDLFLGGPKALLRIENPAANNDRTLIVFRDSFGSSLVPLLAATAPYTRWTSAIFPPTRWHG